MKIGKPDKETDNKGKTGSREKWSRSISLTILVVLFALALLAFSVVNLPGRYKAIVVSEGGVDEVLVLDTVKGNMWRYQGTRDVTVITYQEKLKAGKKVPERIVIK